MAFRRQSICKWKFDDEFDDGVYDTECGNKHYFTEGNVEENNYIWCPFCGKKIYVLKKEDRDEKRSGNSDQMDKE